MDRQKFRNAYRGKGFTFESLAKAVGMTDPTLRARINDDTLTIRDIRALQKVLGLSDSEANEIFIKKEKK